MNKPKILIVGDSFAADWTVKYNDYPGWPTLLADKYSVTNIAQAGVSEYKIYKQVKSIKNLSEYDIIIVSHTSPYRIPTIAHPVHFGDVLHGNSDLIWKDIEYHGGKLRNFFNRSLTAAIGFFSHHYDSEYFELTYKLIRQEINKLLIGKKVITIAHFPLMGYYTEEELVLDFTEMLKTDKGLINHYSKDGNETIVREISNTIELLLAQGK